jgi:hypothetical protein
MKKLPVISYQKGTTHDRFELWSLVFEMVQIRNRADACEMMRHLQVSLALCQVPGVKVRGVAWNMLLAAARHLGEPTLASVKEIYQCPSDIDLVFSVWSPPADTLNCMRHSLDRLISISN